MYLDSGVLWVRQLNFRTRLDSGMVPEFTTTTVVVSRIGPKPEDRRDRRDRRDRLANAPSSP